MWVLIGALVVLCIVLFLTNLYKTRVIEDYEKRTPRMYQEFVDTLNKLKAYLELEDRASREPFMRGLINESICKYARRCRTSLDDLIKAGCEEYIKKN